MSYRHGRYNVVILLKGGETINPIRLACVNKMNCYHPFMMKVNREIAAVIEDNKGIHWSDIPDDVTVIEHKCRSCDYYYKIYTPRTVKAESAVKTMLESEAVV